MKLRNVLDNVLRSYREEVADHRSIGSLWSSIARSEVDALGYGSIDEVAGAFDKRLNISLAQYEQWSSIREYSYRRNLIVHNRGRINDVYRRKIGSSRLTPSTDLDYIKAAAEGILGFLEFIHSQICRKFRLRIDKPRAPT